METINEKLKASIVGTDSLDDFVDAYYDGFEELKDGFQVTDLISLGSSLIGAFSSRKEALIEAMDLQDNEITRLVDLSDNFNLANLATEARQILKLVLVGIQTYDLLTE